MATIALYKSQANQMNELITNTMVSVDNYISELSSLKSKVLSVNSSVCNMDDVTLSIQSSYTKQDEKYNSLASLCMNIDAFITTVESIDDEVAELVNQKKDDFYDNYDYLKPEYEKDLAVKAGEILDSVVEWCEENWESVINYITATVFVITIVTLCLATFGSLAVVFAELLNISILDTIMKLKDDLDNFDWKNRDTTTVENANFFSAYKDKLVLYFPSKDGGAISLFGVIGIGSGVRTFSKNKNTNISNYSYFAAVLMHEYGHTLQLEEMGLAFYPEVAAPSIYYATRESIFKKTSPWGSYHSSPFEYGADSKVGLTADMNCPWPDTDTHAEDWADQYYQSDPLQQLWYFFDPEQLKADAAPKPSLQSQSSH